MRLTTLVSGVQTVLECAKESSGKIAGVDICGEADAEAVDVYKRHVTGVQIPLESLCKISYI